VGDFYGEAYVIIDCSNFTSLVITNSAFITIRNIRFLECGNHISSEHSAFSFPSFTSAAIFIYNVSSLVISNIMIGNSCGHGIIGVNIVNRLLLEQVKVYGNTTISNTCDKQRTAIGGILLLNLYNETDKITAEQRNITVSIKECIFYNINTEADMQKGSEAYGNDRLIRMDYLNSSAIGLVLHQLGGHVDIHIEDTTITNITSSNGPLIFISYSLKGINTVTFHNISVVNTNTTHSTFEMSCKRGNNETDFLVKNTSMLTLSSSTFSYNSAFSIMRMRSIGSTPPCNWTETVWTMNLNGNLFIRNAVGFYLFQTIRVKPLLAGHNLFLNNTANVVFSMSKYITLADGSRLSFINNTVKTEPFPDHKMAGNH